MKLVNTSLTAAAVALLLCALPGVAGAGDWKWSLTPYAWATDIGVDARIRGTQVVDAEIPVDDLIEDLDTIFQARLEGQNGRYGMLVDLFDVTLSDAVTGVALPQDAGQADVASDMGMTIFDAAGFVDLKGDPRMGLSVLGGTRILDERATVDATFTTASGDVIAKSW